MMNRIILYVTLSGTVAVLTLLCSFTLGQALVKHIQDSRRVHYKTVRRSAANFSHLGLTDYARFLFRPQNNEIVVGLRDHLLRLNVRSLEMMELAVWTTEEDNLKLCVAKGQSKDDCHNHMRVLYTYQGKPDSLLACGTYAFSPRCSYRKINELNKVLAVTKGQGVSPYSPHFNTTSVMTSGGILYSGLQLNYQNTDAAIIRSKVAGTTLRTKEFDPRWLNRPNFVGSFEIGDFVYFFFRETAVESVGCEKVIHSRVARLCKNDVGGEFSLENTWTTFIKARLNCSMPGEFPFYYDYIQSVDYVPDHEMFYATFTTPDNSIIGSAVCAFSLSSITETFKGRFLFQKSLDSQWVPRMSLSHTEHLQCRTPSRTLSADPYKYQLMETAVQHSSGAPIYKEKAIRFTNLVVDAVAMKDYNLVHVLFVAGDDGLFRKIFVFIPTMQTCLIEIIEAFPPDQRRTINIMKYLKETQSVYVGTDKEVLKIPVQRCDRYKTFKQCLASVDPYCGWNQNLDKCTTAPGGNPENLNWHQQHPHCLFPENSEDTDDSHVVVYSDRTD